LLLSEKTYNYLCASLRGLLSLKGAEDIESATGGLISLNENHIEEFKEVWKGWLDL
jgi:methylmalonyl-CoA mutase cobalamin-binding subunit